MSDLNDLIHRNASLAYDQGAKAERQRILNIIKEIGTPEDDIGEFFYVKDLKDYLENDYDSKKN